MTNDAFNIPEHAEGPVLRRASSDDTAASAGETSDDILAKYRKKPLAEDKVDAAVVVIKTKVSVAEARTVETGAQAEVNQ